MQPLLRYLEFEPTANTKFEFSMTKTFMFWSWHNLYLLIFDRNLVELSTSSGELKLQQGLQFCIKLHIFVFTLILSMLLQNNVNVKH